VKRLAFWAVLVASLSANLATAAIAIWQRGPARPSEPLLFSKVALDPEQRSRIAALRTRLTSTRDEHMRQMGALRSQLANAVLQQPADPAVTDRALRSIADTQAAYQQAVVEHVLAVRRVLRAEQRPAFDKMVAEQMSVGGISQHDACPMPPGGGR
jgi:Spy/CpxP family protein refolding chaperone